MHTDKSINLQAKGFIRFSNNQGSHLIDVDDIATITTTAKDTTISTHHKQNNTTNVLTTEKFNDIDFIEAIRQVKTRIAGSRTIAFVVFSMDDVSFL